MGVKEEEEEEYNNLTDDAGEDGNKATDEAGKDNARTNEVDADVGQVGANALEVEKVAPGDGTAVVPP